MSVKNCDGCGACCMGQNLMPLTGNELDKVTLPVELRLELVAITFGTHDENTEGRFGPLFGDDKCPCVWLDRATGRCKHYEHRPSFCRELVCGGKACLRIRRKAGL